MQDDQFTIKSGLLAVGDGHEIYYQEWGNKDTTPILSLHGGPGSHTKNKHKNIFDPTKHHVIFFDQRGCGLSTATDFLAHNTIDDLVEDINKLKAHLGVSRTHLFGYSWGSTLALYYATKYPSSVSKLLLGGTYLGTKEENDYLFNGGMKDFAVEAWEHYASPVPEDKRGDCLAYYSSVILDSSRTEEDRLSHLVSFMKIEPALISMDSDFYSNQLESTQALSLDELSGTILSLHYFTHSCFIPEGYFENSLSTLATIPTTIVQGSYDFVCPPMTAKYVAEKIGPSAHLHLVPSSHAREGAMRETLRAYAWSLLG